MLRKYTARCQPDGFEPDTGFTHSQVVLAWVCGTVKEAGSHGNIKGTAVGVTHSCR